MKYLVQSYLYWNIFSIWLLCRNSCAHMDAIPYLCKERDCIAVPQPYVRVEVCPCGRSQVCWGAGLCRALVTGMSSHCASLLGKDDPTWSLFLNRHIFTLRSSQTPNFSYVHICAHVCSYVHMHKWYLKNNKNLGKIGIKIILKSLVWLLSLCTS